MRVRHRLQAPSILLGLALAAGSPQACSTLAEGPPSKAGTGGAGGVGFTAPTSSGVAPGGASVGVDAGSPDCLFTCSPDFHARVDCHGNLSPCAPEEACDVETATCVDACAAAEHDKQSVGCELFATNMDQLDVDVCFAAIVANTSRAPARLAVDYDGQSLAVDAFARVPVGEGPSLSLAPLPASGLPPGEVAILFLAGSPSSAAPCPVPAAVPTGSMIFGATKIGHSFRISSSVPVAAYQMNPYGSAFAGSAGGSLLLPVTAWGTRYMAVTASALDVAPPSMNIVASSDDTTVTVLPKVPIAGGGALPPGPAGVPYVFKLQRGEHAQLTQKMDLSGSIVSADKPIGLMAGQPCMTAPIGVGHCDHAEQMIPPIEALGSEHVGVMFRPRVPGDAAIWRLVAVADDTQLTYDSAAPIAGPPKLSRGESATFESAEPFVVRSQDADHPFMLFTVMSGSTYKPGLSSYGDPDFVVGVPPAQYISESVFFTDPSFPETSLVVVRAQRQGQFEDVELDCMGALTGFEPIGGGAYEWTRVSLTTHNFAGVGACSTGRHAVTSRGRFGLWIWGWGTPETMSQTARVSYGFPGGMGVRPINQAVVP